MNNINKLYICVTDGCNLACKGCYKYLIPSLNKDINFLDLNIVEKYINNYIISNNILDCTFHGGEPFYIDNGRIQKYIDLIKKYENNKNIMWSATTNLVYNISDKHLELFNLLTDKFLKTSWDVNKYRFNNSSQLTLWEENVKKLLSLGFTIQPIITVNTETVKYKPKELFDYFINLGIRNINFERITPTGRAAINNVKPSNREVDNWLYEAYIENKNYNFIIPIFEELENVTKVGFSGCRLRQCMQNVRTINADGSIGACPNCSDKHIIESDNTYNKDIEEQLINNEKLPNQKCTYCKYYPICNGDCCQLTFDESGCPGLTKILEVLYNE